MKSRRSLPQAYGIAFASASKSAAIVRRGSSLDHNASSHSESAMHKMRAMHLISTDGWRDQRYIDALLARYGHFPLRHFVSVSGCNLRLREKFLRLKVVPAGRHVFKMERVGRSMRESDR